LTTRTPPRRLSDFYTLTLLHVACFAFLYLNLWLPSLSGATGVARHLLYAKAAIELLASFYLFSLLLKASDYLVAPGADGPPADRDGRSEASEAPARSGPEAPGRAWPPVACIYLCAGDLDRRALESLCRLEYPGRYEVHVHDDSGDPRVAAEVDEAAGDLAARTGRRVVVLRRSVRDGGKPGAVNHVLDRLADDVALVLLADNDSTAVDPSALVRAAPLFDDARVAVVQFRNVGVPSAGDGAVNRVLVRAIEVFDLFARHQSRHGMALFFGHNALLRRDAVKQAGGLRAGIFADDIDLSLRLVRAGWRIMYAPGIRFGETHPSSYVAFRKRAYKWAFGCGQILRGHFLPALFDRNLTAAQRFGLLEFIGFYALQAVLIGYLVLVGLVLPVVSGSPAVGAPALFASGALVVAAIFLPAFAYYARRRELSRFWPFALICAVVYGSVAFASTRGLFDGLCGRRRRWIPTNLAAGGGRIPPATLLESGFGLLLFLVPAISAPATLWQPSLYLFATVFMLAPVAAFLYAPAGREGSRSRGAAVRQPPALAWPRLLPVRVIDTARTRRVLVVSLLAGLLTAPVFLAPRMLASLPDEPAIAIRGDRFLVDGEPFLVKGVHYSPWLPGTGPGKSHAWPGEEVVERDLAMIRDLGANTILVHDAPASVLAQARRHGLMVIYAYFINWQSIGDDEILRGRTDDIVRSAAVLAKEPNLLAVVLGNEVVDWVLEERGAQFIEIRLRSLRDAVRSVAPHAPIGHANWPIARRLDLTFMDFAAFNLYPSWPREVVVAGYGDYIENTLKPIAAGRPLLITEFGQNTLEATEAKQAQVLRECWREIRARTAGGVVFSFVDEWWKNYDNPIDTGDWWRRAYAPDDERTHDLDPEEYYGIMTSERAPKPARESVREMFAGGGPSRAYTNAALCALPLLALLGYTLFVFRRPPRS
jgi:cellulose synthase/poly-beta-1,6-N-acetylglucosamine synthase-like glycosyltransferase